MAGISIELLLAALMVAATPILLAAIGETVVEKSGVLNLGVEGMMITGAICGFATAVETGSPFLGFVGAAVGGAALSLIFAVLTQILLSNQVATGLALTLFGLGFSALIGQSYAGVKPPPVGELNFGPLSAIPFIGPVLFSHETASSFRLPRLEYGLFKRKFCLTYLTAFSTLPLLSGSAGRQKIGLKGRLFT